MAAKFVPELECEPKQEAEYELNYTSPFESESEIEDTDETDNEVQAPAPKRVAKGLKAGYKTKFSNEWKKQWPFVSSVPNDPYRFWCNICSKKLSCAHQGVSDIKDHISTQGHQRLVKEMTKQSKLSFKPTSNPLSDKVTIL